MIIGIIQNRFDRVAALGRRIVLVVLLFSGNYAAADGLPVVINEVLADEPGSATSLEWVELYNRQDTAIDCSGLLLVDDPDTTSLDGIILGGGEYVILARRVIAGPGEDSFESYWGDNSGVWGDAAGENFQVIPALMKLRNSADTVLLLDPTGGVSLFLWDGGTDDGISFERTRPDSPDETNSFVPSQDPAGSTPGLLNSQTPRANDLAIDSAGMEFHFAATEIIVPVTNVGWGESKANALSVGEDGNNDRTLQEHEIILDVPLAPLAEGETVRITVALAGYTWSGTKILLLDIGDDGNVANNIAGIACRLLSTPTEIVINEYLPDPLPGAAEEWIELYNCSENDIDVQGWRIGDSVGQTCISEVPLTLSTGSYMVVCENRAALTLAYPEIGEGTIIELAGWRDLNNSGDKIILRDPYGFIVDSLTFAQTYDGERSVERLDPAASSGDPANWWGSVDPGGATPGRANSTAVDYSEMLEMTVTPNPFVRGAEVAIECNVPFQTTLSAYVFDINGRKIKTLVEKQPVVSGVIAWDGADDDGCLLAPGVYVMFFQTDSGGSRKIVLAVAPAN